MMIWECEGCGKKIKIEKDLEDECVKDDFYIKFYDDEVWIECSRCGSLIKLHENRKLL